MKTFRTLLFLLTFCAFAGLLLAHDEQEYGNAPRDSYENGYVRGYQHGSEDVRARLNFDFHHDNGYQSNGTGHSIYGTDENCDTRVGYFEGYADGYFRRQARFEVNNNPSYGGNYGYGDDHRGNSGSDVWVVAFSKSGYSGYSQQFRIGQYPHLDGQLNDSINSITVHGNVRVTLYDNGNFTGQRIVLDRDSSDLGSFKSKAASMIVEPLQY